MSGSEPAGWAGSWVSQHAGIEVTSGGATGGRPSVPELAGLALRHNPKRFHLLVSTVLGKHVPVDPAVVQQTGLDLGRRVHEVLGADQVAVVIGYAETATSLGHLVSDALAADYLHSTRRHRSDGAAGIGFEESHSHATSHRLLPDDPDLLRRDGVLVLVDDELTTGSTVLNTVAALQRRHPRPRYVVASLLDLRSTEDHARMQEQAEALGTDIEVVSSAQGRVERHGEPDEEVRRLLTAPRTDPDAPAGTDVRPGRLVRIAAPWPADVPDGGRHGFAAAARPAFEQAASGLAAAVAPALDGVTAVHVLGCEEQMYLPLGLADRLARALPGAAVTFSSTTRSPVLVVDEPGYAVRHAIAFAAHDGAVDDTGAPDPAPRFAYNLEPGRHDAVVVVLDAQSDTPQARGLLDRLRTLTPRVVVVALPSVSGPDGATR